MKIAFDFDGTLSLGWQLNPVVAAILDAAIRAGRECCGASLVESYGGQIVIPDWPVRQSSTRIVERILAQGAAR